VFKFASEDWEFEQIPPVELRTFVEEIPQHKASPTHRLVDKFHAENTYLICLNDQKIVGMLAARGNRPFSLDQKVPGLDTHLPAGRTFVKSGCWPLTVSSGVRAAARFFPDCSPCSGNME